MSVYTRHVHTPGNQRSQNICANFSRTVRFAIRISKAIRDALAHARGIVETETGSATDNPLVFVDSGEVLSGGNFHGAPLALAFDYAALAMTDLISISERRVDRLV